MSEGVAENTSDLRTVVAKLKDVANLDAAVSPTYPKDGERSSGRPGNRAWQSRCSAATTGIPPNFA